MDSLTIGQLANAAGVNVQTVRYYERRGLLAPPPRRESGYRAYADDAVMRLRFIRCAQTLGYTLRDVEEMLSLSARGATAEVRSAIAARIREVDERLGQLKRLRHALSRLDEACREQREGDEQDHLVDLLAVLPGAAQEQG